MVNSKLCTVCKVKKDFSFFYNMPTGKYGKYPNCKKCESERRKKSYPRHRVRRSKYAKIYRKNQKIEAMTILCSGKPRCQKHEEWKCCGNPEKVDYLSFDHIKGNGRQHYQEIRNKHIGKSMNIQRWVTIYSEEAKDVLQIICMNAQMIKRLLNKEFRKSKLIKIPKRRV